MIQVLLNGLIQGSLFALIGLAFSLVYSTTRVFHVALGCVYALAPHVALACATANLGWPVAIAVALTSSVVVGVVLEEFIHWPLERRRAPPEVHIIASLGAYIVGVQVITLTWGHDPHLLRQGLSAAHRLGVASLTSAQLSVVTVCGSLLVLMVWGLHASPLGRELLAMADNARLLEVLGRNIRALRRLAFGLSGALAGAAALSTANDVGFDAIGGMRAVLIGVVVTVVAGRGSFAGTLAAGTLLGLLRAVVGRGLSAQWEEATTFVFLALVLLARPRGLFASRTRIEEQP